MFFSSIHKLSIAGITNVMDLKVCVILLKKTKFINASHGSGKRGGGVVHSFKTIIEYNF